tara:strand:- start:172 stop:684 length:513 start_codon:yes stop_codon:yes gene_type:complete
MRKIVKNKKASILGLSFGTIFSIILIIFFFIIAFFVIRAFLGTQKCAQVGIFSDDFKNEIKKAWNSPKQVSTFKGRLPSSLTHVCFADFSKPFRGEYEEIWNVINIYDGENANTFLYPIEKTCDMPYHDINHLDMENIISDKNPYCIVVESGNIDIEIQKELGDRFVRVS